MLLARDFLICLIFPLTLALSSNDGCSKQSAVCSMVGQVRGKVYFDEVRGRGCFNSGNIQVTIDLRGFPLTPQSNEGDSNGQKDGKRTQSDAYSLRLKSYGEILPACTGIGPDFGKGISAGDLGTYHTENGNLFNDTFYLPQSSFIQGYHSLLGRSVAIYKGPYSKFGNNRLLSCCVIGLARPTSSGATPTTSFNQPTSSVGAGASGPRFSIAPNNNNNNNNNKFNNYNNGPTGFSSNGISNVNRNPFNNNNYNNNYNKQGDDISGKFNLIGDYGGNTPTFGFQTSSPFDRSGGNGFFSTSNSGSNSNNNNNNRGGIDGRKVPRNGGRGDGDGYHSIYNAGNNNYHSNGQPIFGSSQAYPGQEQYSQRGDGAYGNNGHQSNANNNNANFNNNKIFNQNSNDRTGRHNGFAGSQFPSVFGSIGTSDFFNLDGKLAGAAIVKGGPDGAAQLGIGGDDALASSLGKGFVAPKGPSFKDIYNKPTGESPLSAGGFSDTVSPEKQNSISKFFFDDPVIKDTVGLTDEDKFIPRETEDEESSTSYHSDTDSNDYNDFAPMDDGGPNNNGANADTDRGDNSYSQIDKVNRIGGEELHPNPKASAETDYEAAEQSRG